MHRDLSVHVHHQYIFTMQFFSAHQKIPSTNMSLMNKLIYVELHKMTETYTCVNKICSFLYAINLK